MWKAANISVTVMKTNRQCIHLKLSDSNGKIWCLTIVYASPNEQIRHELWEELSSFVDGLSIPWCVMGDFNSILYDFEKVGGAGPNRRAMKDFATCLESCNLMEINSKGPFLTWQRGTVKERLDRVVCTADWRLMFDQATIINLALPTSDHCGLWLNLAPNSSHLRIHKPFKFLASWISHPDFKDQVTKVWLPNRDWSQNLTQFQENLKEWNYSVFGNIFNQKKHILSRLEGIDRKLLEGSNPFLSDLRSKLWHDYESIISREEEYWFQQARVNWLKLGDRNTHFYHQTAIIKRVRNRIDAIQDENNQWVFEDDKIRSIMLKFLKDLLSCHQVRNYPLMHADTFPHIDSQVLSALAITPSIDEVKAALFDIDRIPQVEKHYRESNLWKGICKAWHHVQKGVLWSIGNGSFIRFWSDRFIPGLQPLNNYVLQPIPPELIHLTIAGASLDGQWDLQMLSQFLPQEILQKLFAITPPRQNLDDDSPTWADSCDGQFHLKDTYSQIATGARNEVDTELWHFIWDWNGPPRIKCFLWKCLHGKLPTNEEKVHRGMAGDITCLRCMEYPESIMHSLRDCPAVAEIKATPKASASNISERFLRRRRNIN
ncbi:Reverse transcriptase zinc-binding domain [Sesbania bispinosa]|nr:Reverse transcriptase zinc-binding domain [Sesbania bispinosa]